jgi:hypothetical protein
MTTETKWQRIAGGVAEVDIEAHQVARLVVLI